MAAFVGSRGSEAFILDESVLVFYKSLGHGVFDFLERLGIQRNTS